ncbi:hypothetical protein BASA61_001231 [Batrachochytrium salamandrivorans]|nr:hypothetical protein BASA61_001231 [Batrachochytrium salamandrivorans]KAH9265166.1 hypothetical protein BASA83_011324 [Batrachochytrium salamandrivorans]
MPCHVAYPAFGIYMPSRLMHIPATQAVASVLSERESRTKADTSMFSGIGSSTSSGNSTGSFIARAHVGYILGERFRAPKNPVVLCHGLFGYDRLGPQSVPFLQLQYWRGIHDALVDLGCNVHVARVGSVSSIRTRAHQLSSYLNSTTPGDSINLIAHSMGGLDCRYMISHIAPSSFNVGSLTTIATPHCGSSFMDWCRDALGLGKLRHYVRHHRDDNIAASMLYATEVSSHNSFDRLKWSLSYGSLLSQHPIKYESLSSTPPSQPNSRSDKNQTGASTAKLDQSVPHMSSYPYGPVAKSNPLVRAIFSLMDAPAFTNLTRNYCEAFNQATPDDPNVYYSSYAAVTKVGKLAPLNFSYQIINRLEGDNDGLVSLKSAQWGEFMGTVDCDHWDLVPPKVRGLASAISGKRFDSIGLYLKIVTELADRGL